MSEVGDGWGTRVKPVWLWDKAGGTRGCPSYIYSCSSRSILVFDTDSIAQEEYEGSRTPGRHNLKLTRPDSNGSSFSKIILPVSKHSSQGTGPYARYGGMGCSTPGQFPGGQYALVLLPGISPSFGQFLFVPVMASDRRGEWSQRRLHRRSLGIAAVVIRGLVPMAKQLMSSMTTASSRTIDRFVRPSGSVGCATGMFEDKPIPYDHLHISIITSRPPVA